ncbi:MAG: hypothetical protein ACREYE_33710 [Gammaproteobacteria bacterium]
MYQLLLDDAEVGYVEYDPVRELSILIKHTEILPARTRGQGLGVSARAPRARRHQPDQDLPLCDELRSSPPEYLDVVRADMRASL